METFPLLIPTASAFAQYNIKCILDLTAIDKFDIHSVKSIIFQTGLKHI